MRKWFLALAMLRVFPIGLFDQIREIISGNVTTLTVRDIEIANIPGDMFEPGFVRALR